MAKIIIVIGEHPVEGTSMSIGRDVAKQLEKKGHEVEFQIIKEKLPKGKTLMVKAGFGNAIRRGTRNFRPKSRSKKVEQIAEKNPNCFVFTFHNFGVKEFYSRTAKQRNEQINKARNRMGGMFDQKTKSIIIQHSEHPRSKTTLPNLFTVEIPAVPKKSIRLDFSVANMQLSRHFGYLGEHMVRGIANKISKIVSGKRMNVRIPRSYPKPIIKRRKISIENKNRKTTRRV